MKKLMLANLIITTVFLVYNLVEPLIRVSPSVQETVSDCFSVLLFLQMILYIALAKKLKEDREQ